MGLGEKQQCRWDLVNIHILFESSVLNTRSESPDHAAHYCKYSIPLMQLNIKYLEKGEKKVSHLVSFNSNFNLTHKGHNVVCSQIMQN